MNIGMTNKRLNRKGTGLYAARLFLNGHSFREVADILERDIDMIRRVSSQAVGLLGLFDERNLPGVEYLRELKGEGGPALKKVQAHLDMLIASKGDKLFTKDPYTINEKQRAKMLRRQAAK